MTLRGKSFAVLVEDVYEDQELWYPVQRLREAGAEVSIVGPQAGETYKSKHGYLAKSDKAAKEVSADDFDGVIIAGGYAPDRMRRWVAGGERSVPPARSKLEVPFARPLPTNNAK